MSDYVMTISRTTIDKLGIKLYDTAADAVCEIISNSYDADAKIVTVNIPLGVFLASKVDGKLLDKEYEITIEDDGHGMRQADINDFFLTVGLERRTDSKRKKPNVIGTTDPSAGTLSLEKKRPIMGRKGIGKLAPFGICKEIEVWSAGGKKGDNGFTIANFILKYDDINNPTDKEYYPELGSEDGKISPTRGTKIILRNFLYRKTPQPDVFMRQIARKFNLETRDFSIRVIDSTNQEMHKVTALDIPILEKTRISLDSESIEIDGKKHEITGWIAYSSTPYRNVQMAGIRIYARKKLVSVTRDFGHKSGFTGEYTIRSYLVGVIYADWLDANDDEDLIASDRQDILWSSEKGQALQEWGQKIVGRIGSESVGPLNQRAYEIFLERTNYKAHVKDLFGDTKVYESAMKVGKVFGKMISMHNVRDDEYIERMKGLAIMLAPHSMLVEKLREISSDETSLVMLETLLGDARLAEATSLGQVVIERLGTIEKLTQAIRKKPYPPEDNLQKILEDAPWLIHAEWTMFQANDTLDEFREAFEEWFEKETGKKIITSFDVSDARKKPDFIMLHIGHSIEIIEIKRPSYTFHKTDFERMHLYIAKITKYLNTNTRFKERFPSTNITLICDKISLGDGSESTAYQKLIDDKVLTKKTWEELLNETKEANKDFLRVKNKLIKMQSRKQ